VEDPVFAFERNVRATWDFAKVVQSIRDRYRGQLEPAEERVFNTVQFWTLFFHDLIVLLHEMHRPGSSTERQGAFGRVLAVSIVEGFEDLAELLGRAFEQDMKKIGVGEEGVSGIRKVLIQLRDLRKAHERHLRDLRNTVAAHREHDAEKQWRLIEQQDNTQITKLGMALTTWSVTMLDALTPSILFVSERVVARCGRYEQLAVQLQPTKKSP
jgi:hypothetical protein